MSSSERTVTSSVSRIWALALVCGILAISLGAFAVTWTIPFQEWDAYSSGTWSVLVAQGSPLLTPEVDPILKQRPLVYLVQGLIWRALGEPSMRAARLYSLFYSALLVLATYLVAQSLGRNRRRALLACSLAAASPLVTEQVSSTLTDIPAAALVWFGCWCLLRATASTGSRSVLAGLGAGIAFAASLLAKITVLPVIALLAATTLASRSRPENRRGIGVLAATLVLPALAVLAYFDHLRGERPWWFFLVGWAGPYYPSLARQRWAANWKEIRWFGVFISAAFVAALASYGLRARPEPGGRARWFRALALAALAGYLFLGTRGLTTPIRAYDSPRWDRWIAGAPEVLAVVFLAIYAARYRPNRIVVYGRELLLPAAAFMLLWWWKLGYNRRFLVVVLPAVCVFVAGWLDELLGEVLDRRRIPVFVAMLMVLGAIFWEGARSMDHAFPVFSAHMMTLNAKDGLRPESKIVDILGNDARVLIRLQQIVRNDPRIRVISPDNRLKFYLGSHAVIASPVNDDAFDGFDFFLWIDNPGVNREYARIHHLANPLARLKEGGRLTLEFSGGGYEVYRIGPRRATGGAGGGGPGD